MNRVDMRRVAQEAIRMAREMGIALEKGGTLFLDEGAVMHLISEALKEYGVIYATLGEAKREYSDILEEYAVSRVDLSRVQDGILVYVPRNTVIEEPISTCYALARRGVVQRVYNLYVAEANAHMVTSTGCYALTDEGAHWSLTDVHLGEGARASSIMIHNWRPGIRVSMSKRARILDRAYLSAFYINSSVPERITSMTELLLEGEDSKADSDTIVNAAGSSRYDYISIARLSGPGSSAQLLSRIVARGSAEVRNVIRIEASSPGARGHIECRALQLGNARVSTLPELLSSTRDAELTHEASIGKISREQLNYLFTRGFDEEEATSLIVKGFMGAGLERVPEPLRPVVGRIIEELSRGGM